MEICSSKEKELSLEFMQNALYAVQHAISMYNCSKAEERIIQYAIGKTGNKIDNNRWKKVFKLQKTKPNNWGSFTIISPEIHDINTNDKYKYLYHIINHSEFNITISEDLSEKQQKIALVHEVDHMVFHLLSILRKFETTSQMNNYVESIDDRHNMNLFLFKTEFFSRFNAGNSTMADKNHNWDDTWQETGKSFKHGDSEYAKSAQTATNMLSYRNQIFNLCAKRFGQDASKPKNFNLTVNGGFVFQTFASNMKSFLFSATFDEIFAFQHMMKLIPSSTNFLSQWLYIAFK